jgi:hypothetical protein
MPSYVPRNLEPYKKRQLFDKRVLQLRSAIKSGANAKRVSSLSEKVRLAALAVIKARRSILAERSETDGSSRELENLRLEEELWLARKTEAITSHFADGQN